MRLRLAAAAPEAKERRREDDEREGQAEAEQRKEGQRRDHPVAARLEGAPCHAQQRLDDDGEHRGLEPKEHRLDGRKLAKMRVKHRECQHDQCARQHEEHPRRQPALRAMQLPARIGSELHRLRAGQQHAEVEGGEVFPLGEPAALLDDHPVHQRDLPGRAPEGQEADPRPHLQGLAE